MKNLFLLNLLGFNPEVTCRKGRHAIESIVSRFSLASLICLCMLTVGVGNVWGAIAAGTYELCTSTSDLVASGHYIIASSKSNGTAYAIANTSKSNNRATVSVTVASEKITIAANSTVMTFTLGGDDTNGWTFSTDNYAGTAGMLAATSSSNNRLGVVASPGDNGKWAITFSSGLAMPVAKGTYSRKYMKYNYNNGTPIFNCYSSSGSESVYIYKLAASCDNKVTISKGSETNGTFTLNKTGEQDACDALSVTVTPEPDEHYHVASVSATNPATTGTAGAAVDNGDGTWTITYSANSKGASTINVTFAEDSKASITLSEAGATTTDATTYYVGDTYTLPTSTEATCGTKVLVGWSTTAVATTDTKPTSDFYEKGAEVTLVASQTFYAVFATASGGGSSDLEIDFEGESSTYSDWTFTNLNSQQTNANVTAHGGSYFGSTAGTATASIVTKSKVDPQSLTTYFTKQSNNTSSSTWYIQVSSDGSSWTDVTTQSATSMDRGTWVEVESDLSDYTDVYVRVYYSGSTAVRNIDDLTLTIGGGTSYSAYSTACEACAADPTVGTAQLNGAFSLSSVGVTVTGSDAGTNCAWEDYGFVWGTSANPTVSNNKVQVGTSGSATTWDGALTGSFTVGTTYYYRAYGKNGKAGAAYVYGTDNSFVPRQIEFEENGGSEVADIYVASGTAATAPTAPTKSGYTFDAWYTTSNMASPVNWSAAITENKIYYANWIAKTATITLDGNGGSGHTASITATCWQKTVPAITNPTLTGYDFAGWYSGSGGTGDLVINAAGELQANVSGYTDEDGYWRREADVTLYAKWTIHEYDVTWNVNGGVWTEGTPSTSAEYNTRVASLPDEPESSDCDGSKVFVGWTNAAINSPTDERPAILFTSAGASPVVTTDVTYYAVFASADGGGGGTAATVTFKNSADDSNSEVSDWTGADGVVSSASGIEAYGKSKAYPGIYGLKVGTSKSSGWVGYELSTPATTNTITVDAKQYGTDGGNIIVTVYKEGDTETEYDFGTPQAPSAEGGILTFTSDESMTITDVYVATSTKRAYVKSITVGGGATYTGYITSCCNDAAVVTLTPAAGKIYRAANGTATTTIACSQTGGGTGTWGQVTVSPAATATVSLNGTTINFSATATGTYTISAAYTESCAKASSVKVTVYNKVNWIVAGNEYTEGNPTTEVLNGGSIDVLPTAPDGDAACGGKVFAGWTDAEYPESNTIPTTLYNSVSDMAGVAINNTTNFYAVFATATDGTGATTVYKRATSISEVEAASSVIFVKNDNAGALSTSLTNTSVSPTQIGSGYYLTNPASSLIWTKSGNNNDGYTFTNGTKTLGTNSNTATGTLVTTSPTYSAWQLGEQVGKGADLMYAVIANSSVVMEYYSGWKTYNTDAYVTNDYCGIYIYVPGGLEEYSTECGAKIRAYEVERLTSSKDQTVKSQEITVKGSSLSGSTLSYSISGTDATYFSCELAATTITDETINTTYVISYTPDVYGAEHTATLTLTDGTTVSDGVTLRGRSLPQEFAIVAYDGANYYALEGSMSGTATRPEALPVEVSAGAVVECPTRAVYTLEDLGTPNQNAYLVGPGGRLWGSSSSTDINNKSGNATSQTAWLLSTSDFNTYHITNATTINRGVMLHDGVFGHYATGNYGASGYYGNLQLLPITAKCTCLDAPTPSVVAKSTTAIISWPAIDGASDYVVTCSGGTVGSISGDATKSCTITGLSITTNYTFTVKAVASGSDCSKTYSGSFTTTACDNVPTLDGVEEGILQATISWTCEGTATVEIYSDSECSNRLQQLTGKSSPLTVTDLSAVTTYYYKVFGGGTCASAVGSFTTNSADLDVVEWDTDAITLAFGEGENALITIADQKPATQVTNNVAKDLFFSKYFEAYSNMKLIGVYNGTANTISLENTRVVCSKGVSWDDSSNDVLDLSDLGEIPAFTEYIFFSFQGTNSTPPQPVAADKASVECVTEGEGWNHENWYPTSKKVATITGQTCPFKKDSYLNISGDRSMALQRKVDGDWEFLDLFGAGDESAADNSACATRTENIRVSTSDGDVMTKMNDDKGWYTHKDNGDTLQAGTDYETDTAMVLSTNRFLLIRKNTVVDGQNAVAQNKTDFVTLATEWQGKACGKFGTSSEDSKTTCTNFQYVGTYDYNEYYVKYDTLLIGQAFDDEWNNHDGTYTIPVPDLDTMSCTSLFVELTDLGGTTIAKKTYQVPIMVSENNTMTTAELFRSYGKTVEKCATCDLVILKDAVLTKATDGTTNDVPQVRDLKIYEGGKLVVPSGTNYTVNSLALRRKGEVIPKADVQGTLNIGTENGVSLDLYIDPSDWHFVSLPYDCNVADISFSNGSPAVHRTDYFIKWYDGAYRAEHKTGGWETYTGTVLKKGLGYRIGLAGSDNIKRELRFPMANDVISAEKTDKTIGDVYAYGGDKTDTELTPNHKGWNLIGNPYMMFYATDITNPLAMGALEPDGETYKRSGSLRYLVEPINNGREGYRQIDIATHMPPFTAYFVQVGGVNNATGGDNPATPQTITFNQSSSGQNNIVARRNAPAEETNELMYPVWYGVEMIAPNTEAAKTALLISDEYTDNYDIMNDLVMQYGTKYTQYQHPLLSSTNNSGEMAYNALPDSSAAVIGVPLNYYAYQAGTYTIATDSRFDLEEVTSAQLWDATTGQYYDLLTNNYTFTTAKGKNTSRFRLFVSVERKKTPSIATGVDNLLTDGKLSLVAIDRTLVLSGLTQNADIYVYDMSGKLIKGERNAGEGVWRANVPAQGVYFVRVNSQSGQQTLRTIVK